jgi:hypothetical protein
VQFPATAWQKPEIMQWLATNLIMINLKEGHFLGDLGVGRKIILKFVLTEIG